MKAYDVFAAAAETNALEVVLSAHPVHLPTGARTRSPSRKAAGPGGVSSSARTLCFGAVVETGRRGLVGEP
jgi:hypothetical protein